MLSFIVTVFSFIYILKIQYKLNFAVSKVFVSLSWNIEAWLSYCSSYSFINHFYCIIIPASIFLKNKIYLAARQSRFQRSPACISMITSLLRCSFFFHYFTLFTVWNTLLHTFKADPRVSTLLNWCCTSFKQFLLLSVTECRTKLFPADFWHTRNYTDRPTGKI